MLSMGFKRKDIEKIRSNVGISYALYDEGAWQNELGHGDMSIAPEILRIINHQNKKIEPIDSVLIGEYYGHLSDRSLNIVYNEKLLPAFQPLSLIHITEPTRLRRM